MAEPAPQSGRKAQLIAQWEALPGQRQFAYAYVAGVALLLTLHLGGIALGIFPNLKVWLGIGYSFAEALLFAGAAVFATRTEIMRKERMKAAMARAERTNSADSADHSDK